MLCNLCKIKKVTKKTKKFGSICYNCYKTFCLIKLQCSVCHEYNYLKSKKNGFNICYKCYRALKPTSNKRPLKKCYKCNRIAVVAKITVLGNVCHKCYIPPKHLCSLCNKKGAICSKKNGFNVCDKCYKAPKRKCSICNEINYIKIKSKNICRKCYSQPLKNCSRCKRNLPVAIWLDNKALCKSCYDVCIYLKIESNRIKSLIRKRLRDAFNKPIGHNRYAIDYEAIVKYLGECPGKRKHYHIDHIFPLAAFDFNNITHIKAAFAPENHQWLRARDNLIKSDNYNNKAFVDYLNMFVRNSKRV